MISSGYYPLSRHGISIPSTDDDDDESCGNDFPPSTSQQPAGPRGRGQATWRRGRGRATQAGDGDGNNDYGDGDDGDDNSGDGGSKNTIFT